MKICTAFVVPLLLILFASGVYASATWQVVNNGTSTTYVYSYTNTEESADYITGFHVYAPVDASLITNWDADTGWEFGIESDPTGASDICWYTDDAETYGISDGNMLTVSITAASTTTTVYDYVLEDFPVGNWGYDAQTSGGTWVMIGSLAVPSGSETAETPEPASLLALLAGCAAVIARRRK
ncbi:MAG: PEP-CTERM sorting domain-containing protein [Armatimonadota bacterium]|nr:PEP-CTERM sorting domain-containing protein [bacterium]